VNICAAASDVFIQNLQDEDDDITIFHEVIVANSLRSHEIFDGYFIAIWKDVN